jgi:hypothetical protein
LSQEQPSHTFWNDPESQKDPWGTITLVEVLGNCTVLIRFGHSFLKAKPSHAFPGTGIVVVDAWPAEQSTWLRSKWTHTIIEDGR